MQFQVPQFIETEDKIIGPFTMRQFVYVGVAGGISALLYFTVQTWLWFVGTLIVFGGAIALAFVKIEGRALSNVVAAAFGFYWKPQTYIWQAQQTIPVSTPKQTETKGVSLENVFAGMALHKRWENLQTGEKIPEKKAVEHKMVGRYQIFEKVTGERSAAKRVDYR
jgi:hypothetical protein